MRPSKRLTCILLGVVGAALAFWGRPRSGRLFLNAIRLRFAEGHCVAGDRLSEFQAERLETPH